MSININNTASSLDIYDSGSLVKTLDKDGLLIEQKGTRINFSYGREVAYFNYYDNITLPASDDIDALMVILAGYLSNPTQISLADSNGNELFFDENSIITRDYLQAVAEGDISGHTILNKVGYHPASTTSETTVWGVGTQYSFPSAEIAVEIVSSSAQDTAGIGSGAWTIKMGYLDSSYVLKSHIFTMDGTNPVAGPTDFFRVNTIYVASGAKTAGNVSIRLVGGAATVYGYIQVGHTTNRSSVITVPASKTLYIEKILFSAAAGASGKAVRMTLHTSVNPEGIALTGGNLFYNQFETMVVDGAVAKTDGSPIICPAKTDVKVSVKGESGAQCTSSITGWTE